MDEDEIAARLHGYYKSDSESSDNSDSDEELLNALRPPPIPLELEPENIVRVEAFKTVSYKKHKIKIPDVSNKRTNSSFVNKSECKNKTKANRNKKTANCKNTKDKKDSNIVTKCQQNKKPQLSPISSENSYADIVKSEIKDEKNDLTRSVDYKNPEIKRATRKKKRKRENVDKSNTPTPCQINKPKTSDIASNVSSGSNLDLLEKSKLEKKRVHFVDNTNYLNENVLSSTSERNGKISNVNAKERRETLIQEQKKYQQDQITKEKRPLVQNASNDNVNEKRMLQNKKKVVPLEKKMLNSGDHNSIEITSKAKKKGKKKNDTNIPNDVLSSSNNPKNDTKEMELKKKAGVVEVDKIHVLQERKRRMLCDASIQTEVIPSSSGTSTRSAVENNLLLSHSQEVTASNDGNQKNGISRNKKKKKKKTTQSASYRSNLQENMMSADIKNHNTGDKKKGKKQSNSSSNTAHLQENETEKQQEKALPSSINHKNYNGSMIIEKIQDVDPAVPNSSVQSTSSSLSHQLQANRFINGSTLPDSRNLNDLGDLLQHDFDWFLKNFTADMFLRIANDMEESSIQ